jgi:hypothetical protein
MNPGPMSMTSRQERPSFGFLPRFESEFRKFDMFPLSSSQRVDRESPPIIRNDGQPTIPMVFPGVAPISVHSQASSIK